MKFCAMVDLLSHKFRVTVPNAPGVIFKYWLHSLKEALRCDVCGRHGPHETMLTSGQPLTGLDARAVHDEVRCRHVLALLQRVPQALLGRL